MSVGSPGALVTVKTIPAGAVRVAVVNGVDPRLAEGEAVILLADGAPIIGRVVAMASEIRDRRPVTDHTPRVIRRATAQDQYLRQRHEQREREAFRIGVMKVRERGLAMKLTRVEQLFDGSRLVFFFTAEDRVDFRELVRELASEFKTRIELRQIGVRDEARVVGGVGVCGRTYCCHGVTDKLKAVSIKMAKEQNLTLNSMKISGPCGRLLCCLAYEYDTYRDCRRGLPGEGSRLRAGGQTLKVLDVNIFTRTLKLAGEDGETVTLAFEALSYDEQAGQWQMRET